MTPSSSDILSPKNNLYLHHIENQDYFKSRKCKPNLLTLWEWPANDSAMDSFSDIHTSTEQDVHTSPTVNPIMDVSPIDSFLLPKNAATSSPSSYDFFGESETLADHDLFHIEEYPPCKMYTYAEDNGFDLFEEATSVVPEDTSLELRKDNSTTDKEKTAPNVTHNIRSTDKAPLDNGEATKLVNDKKNVENEDIAEAAIHQTQIFNIDVAQIELDEKSTAEKLDRIKSELIHFTRKVTRMKLPSLCDNPRKPRIDKQQEQLEDLLQISSRLKENCDFLHSSTLEVRERLRHVHNEITALQISVNPCSAERTNE